MNSGFNFSKLTHFEHYVSFSVIVSMYALYFACLDSISFYLPKTDGGMRTACAVPKEYYVYYGSLDEVTAYISVVSSVPLPAIISYYCQNLNTNAKLDIHLRFHDSDVVCRYDGAVVPLICKPVLSAS